MGQKTEFACANMQAVLPKAIPTCVGIVWVEQESWTLARLACVQAVAKARPAGWGQHE